jgi:hypothetical protein
MTFNVTIFQINLSYKLISKIQIDGQGFSDFEENKLLSSFLQLVLTDRRILGLTGRINDEI